MRTAGPFSVLRNIYLAARLNRTVDTTRWQPARVAVIPLETGAPTSIVAALTAIAGARLQPDPLVAVDTGPQRELRFLLGATTGDLSELCTKTEKLLERRRLRRYVDTDTRSGPSVIAPPVPGVVIGPTGLDKALRQLERHYRSIVVDVPGAAAHLTREAAHHADRIVAVTTGDRIPDWITSSDSLLLPLLGTGNAAVVRIGSARAAGAGDDGAKSIPSFEMRVPRDRQGQLRLPTNTGGIDLDDVPDDLKRSAIQLADFVFAAR
ncbi:MAG: hypothetical protein QM662_16455 [Gordonia sp. (in: high G+C Gram-positive bacteria)]